MKELNRQFRWNFSSTQIESYPSQMLVSKFEMVLDFISGFAVILFILMAKNEIRNCSFILSL